MDTPAGSLKRYQMFIGGEWMDAAAGGHFESDNPYTGKPWALIPRGGAADVERAVQAARKAFTTGEWPKLNPSKRGALLRKLGDLITDKSKALAEIEVRDNGKLYAEMSAQTAYMAQWYYYYGGLAVVFIVHDDHSEVARLLDADGRETAQSHQQFAVAGHHQHAALRLGERQAKADHRGAAHRAPQIEIESVIAGSRGIPGRRAQTRYRQCVAAVAQDIRHHGTAFQDYLVGFFRHVTYPMSWSRSHAVRSARRPGVRC
jgi:hypothetical protein